MPLSKPQLLVFIGSDHAGIALREHLAEELLAKGHQVKTFGPSPGERSDYPDAARDLCAAVLSEEGALGVLICGTGIGMSMAANKVKGIRAALVHDPVTAALAREHNNANVLCLGARLLAEPYAIGLVETWLDATFDPRHLARIEKVHSLEEN